MFDACVRPYDLMWWLWFFFILKFFSSLSTYLFHRSQLDFCLWTWFVVFSLWLNMYLFCVRMISAAWMKFGFSFLLLLWMQDWFLSLPTQSFWKTKSMNEWIEWEIWNSDWIRFYLSIWAWMTFPLTFMESSKVWAHF